MDLNEIIKKIDNLKDEVDKLRPLNPDQEQRLLQKIRLNWNYHSSHIEGNTLTYGETKALILWGITAEGKPLRDHNEIIGHNKALEYILDIIKGKEIPLTESFIRDLHSAILPDTYELDAKTADGKLIKRKITPGEYKKMPNSVETKTGEMFYFATPAETPAKMMDLMNWYKKAEQEKNVHPLIIASIFHYKFVRIHPFDDGNGRMSRILMNLILMKFAYPPVIIPTGMREDYLNSLQYADADDFDKFTIFIGERLVESLELWLKAANGEPIDEYDDIDKMVALLKNKIDSISDENIIKKTLSFPVFKDIYNNSINPLLVKTIEKLGNFDSLFNRIEVNYNFGNGEILLKPFDDEINLIPNNENYIDALRSLIYTIIEKEKIIYSIEIYYKYIGFIKSGTNPFDVGVSLKIEFNEQYYEINSPSIDNLKLRKLYHQNLNDDEISLIYNELGKYINDNIEKSIENLLK